jgi:hypothetical protein
MWDEVLQSLRLESVKSPLAKELMRLNNLRCYLLEPNDSEELFAMLKPKLAEAGEKVSQARVACCAAGDALRETVSALPNLEGLQLSHIDFEGYFPKAESVEGWTSLRYAPPKQNLPCGLLVCHAFLLLMLTDLGFALIS